jgi:NTP pyrophosphatase (non-canonical NTP hydrolase)
MFCGLVYVRRKSTNMLEKFSSLDYKFQAALKILDNVLDFADQEFRQKLVSKIINYLNKKYLKGSYFLPVEECDSEEILKNAAQIEKMIPIVLERHKNHDISLCNSKAAEKYNSSDSSTQSWLEFLDILDEWYLGYGYSELCLLNATEKNQAEIKKDLLEIGLDKILPLSLPDMVEHFLEEIFEILADKFYGAAKEKGFHSEEEKERDPQNTINTVAKHGMNLVSEVVEFWEAARKGKLDEPCDKSPLLKNKEEEIADYVIRSFDSAKTFGINLGRAVRLKYEVNKNRPLRNGGKLA